MYLAGHRMANTLHLSVIPIRNFSSKKSNIFWFSLECAFSLYLVHYVLKVIKKGGGIGPFETLATLDFEKVLRSTLKKGRITKKNSQFH